MNGEEGGRGKMATPVEPARPTRIEFETEAEMQRFVNYATSKTKSKDAATVRVREMLRKHREQRTKK